jgi:hypothetical protein
MFTPRTMSSRSGPRKPGHSAGFVFTIGGGAAAAGFDVTSGFGVSAAGAAVGAAAGAGAATGSSCACARRRSSGVIDQRQWMSDVPSPLMPPVRSTIHGRHPSTAAPSAAAARPPGDKRRLTAAQPTSATASIGIARM